MKKNLEFQISGVNKNGYVPNPKLVPIENLPMHIKDELEKMAENVHETWAYQKMAEGWTFGEAYDLMAKKHPSLKPYAELDESQKNYDRNTALATLSFLMNEGIVISK
jgi:hypothetical protein